MSQRVLEALQPKRVFYYFEELCRIPHGSKNTKQISDFVAAFAQARELRFVQDETNNVVIFKEGSRGYENHPPVILQGHLDMVAEKTPESRIEFLTDPLDIHTDGTEIWAEGTTLGGDDGIAVAYMLALLESETIPHPPLECVFTVDEEIGMDGAEALDMNLLRGRRMINIDSEDEGVLTVGCAGGARVDLNLPVQIEPAQGKGIHIYVDGLLGGHSGQMIDKGRANADILLGALLDGLLRKLPYRLVYVRGGQKDNAIPRSAMAKIIVADNRLADAHAAIRELADGLISRLPAPETGVRIWTEDCPCRGRAMNIASTRRTVGLLSAVPNGVQSMSQSIPGLVQTSLNLGVLKTEGSEVQVSFSVRSSVNREKTALMEQLFETGEGYSAVFTAHGEYPAWEYRESSPLREKMVRVFESLYGRAPSVVTIHAGLECGLFSDRLPGLDCVSFGPDMKDIHTTSERLDVASAARTWKYLLAVLEQL